MGLFDGLLMLIPYLKEPMVEFTIYINLSRNDRSTFAQIPSGAPSRWRAPSRG